MFNARFQTAHSHKTCALLFTLGVCSVTFSHGFQIFSKHATLDLWRLNVVTTSETVALFDLLSWGLCHRVSIKRES